MGNPYRSRCLKQASGSKYSYLQRVVDGFINKLSNAQEIEIEARIQNDIISDLQNLMSNAETRVRNGMKRLNRTINQQNSNHILQVIIFGLACFTLVYLWSKQFRR